MDTKFSRIDSNVFCMPSVAVASLTVATVVEASPVAVVTLLSSAIEGGWWDGIKTERVTAGNIYMRLPIWLCRPYGQSTSQLQYTLSRENYELVDSHARQQEAARFY